MTKFWAVDSLLNLLELRIGHCLDKKFCKFWNNLGGDVYRLVNGALRSNYDNWYCDELPNEFLSDFVIRSIDKAKQYIESYNIKKGDDIFFTLVPKV